MKSFFVLSILFSLGILFESHPFVSGYFSPRNWVDFPYMVKFTRKTSLPGHDQPDLVCTGALIERNLVMTTSSCFQGQTHFHHFNITHSAIKSTFGFEISNWDLIYRSFSQTQRLNRKVVATHLQPITRILFLQLEPVDSSSYYIETGVISRENPRLDGHKSNNLSVVYFNGNREYHRAITLDKIRVHSVGHLSLNFDMDKDVQLPLGSLIISNLQSNKPKILAIYTHHKDDNNLFRATKFEVSAQFLDSVRQKMHQTELINSIIAYFFILVLLVIASALATVWYHKNRKSKVEEIVVFKKEENRDNVESNGRSTNERNLVLELKNRLIFKGFYGRFEERNGNASETVI